MLHGRVRPFARTAAGGIDAAALAWRAAVIAGGGTVSAPRLLLVGALAVSLKSAGVWTSLDRLWLLAAENTQSALIDIKAVAPSTAVAAPGFTVDRGYQGNGTTAYIDSGFNWQVPSIGANHYVQDSAGFGVWCETLGSGAAMGNENGAYGRIIYGSPNREFEINSGSANPPYAPSTLLGFFHAQRIGPASSEGYGASGALEDTDNGASFAVGNRNFYVLANNNGGTPASLFNGRLSAAWIGGSLTAPQALAFYNALRTYMTAVGVP